MHDSRIDRLADLLLDHSCTIKRGEKVLIMENVNAQRVAVRSIAWLGDLLAGIVKLSKLGSKK